MKKIYFLICLISVAIGFSQNHNSCVESLAQLDSNSQKEEYELIIEKLNTDSLKVIFVNNSDQDIFIFSSYFDDEFSNSRYLNRINKKEKERKKSFLPLRPYLSPSINNGRFLPKRERLNRLGYVGYKFIKIASGKMIEQIFTVKSSNSEFVRDINLNKFGVANKINWKNKKYKKCYEKYNLILEFALYKNISGLCDIDVFINNTYTFDKTSKSYLLISGNVPN